MKRKSLRLRKWLAVMLVLCLAVGMLVVPGAGVVVKAAEEGDFQYRVVSESQKTIAITKYTGSGAEVVIPSEINGYKVTSIGEWAFYECRSLSSITILEGVTSIDSFAFYGCRSLSSITIPEGITSIGTQAFYECSNLSSIEIPESVTNIGNKAFASCSSLSSITIPKGVTSIGEGAFKGCTLNNIVVDNKNENYTSLEDVLYNKSLTELITCSVKKTEVNIPESVTSIGNYAFYGCRGLSSITIPENVTSIGNGAFGYCESLNSITIPKGVTNIGNGLEHVGDGVFEFCRSLSSIIIPEGVTRIGERAFYGCTGLSSITIPNSVTSIGDCAFGGCNSLNDIVLDNKNEYYTSLEGVIYNKTLTELVIVPREKREVNIPESVTSIGNCAFYGCKNLSSITIPKSVTSIGKSAFQGCGLSSITIPDSVTSIGQEAFLGCISLSSITIPGSVTSIGYLAFANCHSLSGITIPEGVMSIVGRTFERCWHLTEITNYSAKIIYLDNINSDVQWYDASTGEVITELGKGTAVAKLKHMEIDKFSIELDADAGFTDKVGNKLDYEQIVIGIGQVTYPEQDIANAAGEVIKDAADKSKVVYYDISAYINAIGGEPAALNGSITITLPYPEGITKEHDIIVLHNTSLLGNVKKYDDYFTFKTDGLSPFTIIALESGKASDDNAVHGFVNRLYTLVLDREADETGLESWTNALVTRQSSGVDAGYGFVFSDECKGKNLSNEDFVEILYNTFMNRPSDEGGKSAWVSQLDAGVEREKVFEGFIYSAEFAEICVGYGINVGSIGDVSALVNALSHYRNQNADITRFVARCYTEAMGREYEPDGLEAWCKVIIEKSNTPKQVAQNFIFSAEFVQKDLSDEEYVKVLYRTFMGREADEGGLAAWAEVLKSGREDRAKVLEGFSDSAEFAEILQSFGLN